MAFSLAAKRKRSPIIEKKIKKTIKMKIKMAMMMIIRLRARIVMIRRNFSKR